MKLRNKLRFMIDLQLRHTAHNLLIIIMLIMRAVATIYGTYTYEKSIYNEKKTREIYNSKLEDIYFLRITDYDELFKYDIKTKKFTPGDSDRFLYELKENNYKKLWSVLKQ